MALTKNKHYRLDVKTEIELQNKALAMNISESEYVRRCIRSNMIPEEKDILKSVEKELSAIGNNINQIAYKANINNFTSFEKESIDNLVFEFKNLKIQIRLLREKYQ